MDYYKEIKKIASNIFECLEREVEYNENEEYIVVRNNGKHIYFNINLKIEFSLNYNQSLKLKLPQLLELHQLCQLRFIELINIY